MYAINNAWFDVAGDCTMSNDAMTDATIESYSTFQNTQANSGHQLPQPNEHNAVLIEPDCYIDESFRITRSSPSPVSSDWQTSINDEHNYSNTTLPNPQENAAITIAPKISPTQIHWLLFNVRNEVLGQEAAAQQGLAFTPNRYSVQGWPMLTEGQLFLFCTDGERDSLEANLRNADLPDEYGNRQDLIRAAMIYRLNHSEDETWDWIHFTKRSSKNYYLKKNGFPYEIRTVPPHERK